MEASLSDLIGLFDIGLPECTEMERSISSVLQNAVPACSIRNLDEHFVEVLFKIWRLCPFTINSAYRSIEYEKSKGRSGSSSHCRGLAADIACLSNLQRYELVSSALAAGVRRIGIAKNFVHIDIDSSKPQNRIWTYDDKNKERKG